MPVIIYCGFFDESVQESRMSQSMLEKRVTALERQVAELRATLAKRPLKDWKSTVGIFSDDPGMLEIFDEALKIREEDRRRTRPKPLRKRKAKA